MKKIIRFSFTMLLVLVFTSSSFAAMRSDGLISSQYIGADRISTIFDISSDGEATMHGILTPKNATVIDKVVITFVIKDSSGSTVYNKTHTATWNSVYNRYEVKKAFKLNKRGNYKLQTLYSCYKNNRLIEAISGDQVTRSY